MLDRHLFTSSVEKSLIDERKALRPVSHVEFNSDDFHSISHPPAG